MKAPIETASKVVSRRLKFTWATVIIAGLCLASSAPGAEPATKSNALPAKSKSTVTQTSHTTKNGESPVKGKKAVRYTGHSTSKPKAAKPSQNTDTRDARRRSAIRPEPRRVEEIQRALIEAGELRQEPTGKWDEATRDAMKRYQQGQGFPVTGLPDSKSLMKMGLGPHPLPSEVATPAATRASLDSAVGSAPVRGPNSDDPPASADPPEEHRRD